MRATIQLAKYDEGLGVYSYVADIRTAKQRYLDSVDIYGNEDILTVEGLGLQVGETLVRNGIESYIFSWKPDHNSEMWKCWEESVLEKSVADAIETAKRLQNIKRRSRTRLLSKKAED